MPLVEKTRQAKDVLPREIHHHKGHDYVVVRNAPCQHEVHTGNAPAVEITLRNVFHRAYPDDLILHAPADRPIKVLTRWSI